jgi:hypothetical protein
MLQHEAQGAGGWVIFRELVVIEVAALGRVFVPHIYDCK